MCPVVSASRQDLMSDKLRGPKSSPGTAGAKESGVGRAGLAPHSQAPESCAGAPWSLISFNSPNSPIRSCHNILTFKTITGIILVSCFKKNEEEEKNKQLKNQRMQ